MALATPFAATAQALVRYGDYRAGSIASAGQVDRYFLQGVQAGDTLRIAFQSQYSGYPCSCYHHRLDVSDGTTPVGPGISGAGTLTANLSSTNTLTIAVRAIDNQRTGPYSFQVDRLNSPAGADRVALDWNMTGSIGLPSAFAVYTLRAEAGSSAELQFTSQYTGYPCSCYHHWAEILDSGGTQVAVVNGNGSSPFTFQATGVYTVFVAAQDFAKTGFFAVNVACKSWPGIPCDTQAYAGNYCQGWPGTGGIVPTLTASTPVLGSTVIVAVGNSAGTQTLGWLLLGIGPANVVTPPGPTLCVANPLLVPMSLPPQGGSASIYVPNDKLLLGLGFALQSLIVDPGGQGQLATSRGLVLITGY